MAELNLIKTRQLDLVDFGEYFSGLLTNSFGPTLAEYLSSGGGFGSSVVYATNVNQSISGEKTFTTSPFVPYSGTSGQAISRAYVDDRFGVINSTLSSLSSSAYVYSSGNQTVSGVKTFNSNLKATGIQSLAGNEFIDLVNAHLINSGGSIVFDWNGLELNGAWTSNGGLIIDDTSAQTIIGIKTFTGGLKVPATTSADFAIPYKQFKTEVDSIRQEITDFTNNVATGDSSGFGGVLAINRASGYIFTQGRGNVTVWQQGNLLNISGADIQSGFENNLAINKVSFPSGSSKYDVPLSGYSTAPFVLSQLGSTNTGNSHLGYYIGNVSNTGFSVLFSDVLDATGFYLDYMALDSLGVMSFLKGEQGLLGPSLNPRGEWSSGVSYGFLDLVRINGVSWIGTQTHVSDLINSPTGVSGTANWQLFASGSGPQGDSAVLFNYKGYWNNSLAYASGDGVSYNGATYGTISTTFAGQSPTGSPWYLLTDKGEAGDGFTYRGSFASGQIYHSGDVVFHNNASYIYTGSSDISGNHYNPNSLISPWSLLLNKGVIYIEKYSPNTVYYQNDLVGTNTGFNSNESVQYINDTEEALYGVHPYGHYNSFLDCDNFSGKNLFVVTTGVKDINHPLRNSGSSLAFKINGVSVNESGKGIGTLHLVRGQTYFFDSELTSAPFILTTNSSGNGYNGQINNGVYTGSRLTTVTGSYVQMGLNSSLYSGTMLFIPNNSTPDVLYYQSPSTSHMGWKIRVWDQSPWTVFLSGAKGDNGAQGIQGAPGGGIAFNWRGAYDNDQYYVADDAVEYSGSSFGHTGSDAIIGIPPTGEPWFVIAAKGAKGEDARGLAFVWQGIWSSSSGYSPYDAVYYNGASYATTGSPSGNFPPPTYPDSWFVIAQKGATGERGLNGSGGLAFLWKGNYSPSTNYSSGDSVFFAGSSYAARVSGSGIIPTGTGQSQWDIVARGGGSIFSWRGTYSDSLTYSSGDSVYYQGSSYATLDNTSTGQLPTSSPWFLVAQKGDTGAQGAQGIQGTGGLAFLWKGTWSGGSGYSANDAVYYDGSSYATQHAITGSLVNELPSVSAYWFPIAKKGDPGLVFNWRGEWSSLGSYDAYDSVYYNGSSYATIFDIDAGVAPGTDPWFLISRRGDAILDIGYFTDTVSTGRARFEKIISNQFSLTGVAAGLATVASAGTTLSGMIYKRTISQVRVNLTGFTLPQGSGFAKVEGYSFPLYQFDRLGIDISGGGVSFNGSGLSVGMFGYLSDY